MVKDNSKPSLELLSKLPGTGDGGRRVVQDVTDEVKTRDFAWNRCTVYQKGRDNDVADLFVQSASIHMQGQNDSDEPQTLIPHVRG